MIIAGPLAHVAPGISVIVSLKAFAVELKNNCPSTVFVNVDGAVHSSVAVVALDPSYPPAAKAKRLVPDGDPPPEFLTVLKSATSVQVDPLKFSVIPTTAGAGVNPPKAKASVLVPDPLSPSLAVFKSPVSVQLDPLNVSVKADPLDI